MVNIYVLKRYGDFLRIPIWNNANFRRYRIGSETISRTANVKNWYIFFTDIVYFTTKRWSSFRIILYYIHVQATYIYFKVSSINVYYDFAVATLGEIINDSNSK